MKIGFSRGSSFFKHSPHCAQAPYTATCALLFAFLHRIRKSFQQEPPRVAQRWGRHSNAYVGWHCHACSSHHMYTAPWGRLKISASCWVTTLHETGNPFGLRICKVKVKFSLYRPWRPLWLREVEAPTFSDIRLIDGGQGCQPYAPATFHPQENSWYSFLLEAEPTPGT
jgi:hypothetical protein